jgi:hypothetical protein
MGTILNEIEVVVSAQILEPLDRLRKTKVVDSEHGPGFIVYLRLDVAEIWRAISANIVKDHLRSIPENRFYSRGAVK